MLQVPYVGVAVNYLDHRGSGDGYDGFSILNTVSNARGLQKVENQSGIPSLDVIELLFIVQYPHLIVPILANEVARLTTWRELKGSVRGLQVIVILHIEPWVEVLGFRFDLDTKGISTIRDRKYQELASVFFAMII